MSLTANFKRAVTSGNSSLTGSGSISASVNPIVNIDIATTVTATLDGVAFTDTNLKGLYMLSDTNVTVTFVGSGGNDVVDLLAGIPMSWDTSSYLPIPVTHTSVSSVTVHNATGGTANFQAMFFLA